MLEKTRADLDWFRSRIETARERANTLHQEAGSPSIGHEGLLSEIFEELNTSLEELQVTGEELRQQNDALGDAQQAIAEERLRYQNLFDFAPDPYLITDRLGHVLEANRAALEMFGMTARRLSGKPLAVYVAADYRQAFRVALDRSTKTEDLAQWETMLHPRGQDPFPVAVSISVVRAAAGNVEALRWLMRDVSERRDWESRLREANEALEARVRERTLELERAHAVTADILESITDAFYALDSEYRFTYVNRAAERLWGRPRAEFLGKTMLEALPQAAAGEPYALVRRAMIERVPLHFEAFSTVIDRWIEAGVYPTPEGGLSVYFRDISERKTREAAERQEREHSQRIVDVLQSTLMQTVSENALSGLATSTLYKAASDEALVGGDFYDIFTIDHGKAVFVVGDVSGKGLPAAAHIAEVKYALRAFLRETISPGAALARLNNAICEAQQQEDWDPDSLVVLAVVVLDPSTGEAVYSSAGAEPLLIFALEEETVTEHGRGLGLVLGAFSHRDYDEITLTVPPGAMLLMATDGITEARCDGVMLGQEGLTRLIQQSKHLGSVGEISRAIMDATCRFAGGPLSDDACLLVARRTAT